ncbi:redoxin family protein [Agaribacter marinus]|uniref:Thiol:disulfide interchange protein DsbE n=1 Tax=Agaribacter marinus TaxID=1431249 RepID=A0AA37T1V4_9ALTE|nr:redoxin family protein [Agaribacter marinus]GLR70898.1 thiol:disulfide interchange protein DsbE [Agaribacter marinus]
MSRLTWFLIPLILFLLLTVFLYNGLFSDPSARESSLIENEFPAFSLPDLADEAITHTNDIFDGQMTFVNVWGVWCVTCAIELPYLTELSQKGYRFVGLYYDQDLDPDFGSKTINRVRAEVIETTRRFGNPFAFNIFDVYRDTSLDLGVTGAPETFLVDPAGVIRLHHLGDINERVWTGKFLPVIEAIQREYPVLSQLSTEHQLTGLKQ